MKLWVGDVTHGKHILKRAMVMQQQRPYLDTSICPHHQKLDCRNWPQPFGLRNPLSTANQGNTDIQTYQKNRAIQLLLGHTILESTVRYLGIKVDNALEFAEQTEV